MTSKETIKIVRSKLLKWYREEKRDLPWRKTTDPYLIWTSEVMLQQTQVKTVIPYYTRWIKSFPTVESLAKASETLVLKHWEGLGYYSRVRNFHRSAKIVVNKHKGKIPETFDEISLLPGIGPYTASAVLSIAFNKPEPVLDGNIQRVLSRWFCLKENGYRSESKKKLWLKASEVLARHNPGDFNQAMMELGATICLPKNPTCLVCPVKKYCHAFCQNRQTEFPPPKTRTVSKKIEVSAAVIWRNGKVFVQQRPKNGLMGGLWEFPGGKLEKGESPEQCLEREIREELGVKTTIEVKLMTIRHAYTQFRVTLHVFQCSISGPLKPTQCEAWSWAKPSSLEKLPFPSANAKIVHHIITNQNTKRDTTIS